MVPSEMYLISKHMKLYGMCTVNYVDLKFARKECKNMVSYLFVSSLYDYVKRSFEA